MLGLGRPLTDATVSSRRAFPCPCHLDIFVHGGEGVVQGLSPAYPFLPLHPSHSQACIPSRAVARIRNLKRQLQHARTNACFSPPNPLIGSAVFETFLCGRLPGAQ